MSRKYFSKKSVLDAHPMDGMEKRKAAHRRNVFGTSAQNPVIYAGRCALTTFSSDASSKHCLSKSLFITNCIMHMLVKTPGWYPLAEF
jgi:hypothetical protein